MSEHPQLTDDERQLLAKMSSNPRIVELLQSPSVRLMMEKAIEAKKQTGDSNIQELERQLRQQGQGGGGGIKPLEETFLKQFLFESDEFKSLVKELLDSVID